MGFIENLLEKLEHTRNIQETRTEYGRYSARQRVCFYNDGNKCYDNPVSSYDEDMEVKSAKAFCDYIAEELTRRSNIVGRNATVKLTLAGGDFCADDNFSEGCATYSRLKSEQLVFLEKIRNRDFSQQEFLEVLQTLKPSLIDFRNLWEKFSKLRIQKNAKLVANPVFDDGGTSEEGMVCTYEIFSGANEGLTEDVRIPLNFTATMPFVKAGEKTYGKVYDFEVELVVSRNNDGVLIHILVPNYETVIEQAIIDESEYVKERLSSSTQLLVLADL